MMRGLEKRGEEDRGLRRGDVGMDIIEVRRVGYEVAVR